MSDLKVNEQNEVVIWNGKKAVFTSILDSINNNGIIPAVIVLLIDMLIFTVTLMKVGPKSAAEYLWDTAWLHYIPLVIYLGGAAFSALRSVTTDYAITNKYVYIRYGVFKKAVISNDIDDIEYVSVYKNFFDRLAHTADITVFTRDEAVRDGGAIPEEKYITFRNIKNYVKVFELIEKIRNRNCPMNDPALLEELKTIAGQTKA